MSAPTTTRDSACPEVGAKAPAWGAGRALSGISSRTLGDKGWQT